MSRHHGGYSDVPQGQYSDNNYGGSYNNGGNGGGYGGYSDEPTGQYKNTGDSCKLMRCSEYGVHYADVLLLQSP